MMASNLYGGEKVVLLNRSFLQKIRHLFKKNSKDKDGAN
jgi:hypothetical protein